MDKCTLSGADIHHFRDLYMDPEGVPYSILEKHRVPRAAHVSTTVEHGRDGFETDLKFAIVLFNLQSIDPCRDLKLNIYSYSFVIPDSRLDSFLDLNLDLLNISGFRTFSQYIPLVGKDLIIIESKMGGKELQNKLPQFRFKSR